MSTLYNDIFLQIGNFLSNRDKINLSMLWNSMYHLKFRFTYHEKVNIMKIAKLPYFINFTNVEAPQSILPNLRSDKCIYFKSRTANVPDNVTHLTFDDDFNQPLLSIPPSVKYLAFGKKFNQPIDFIPTSVTHLIFGDDFNQPIKGIPESVVFLIFGYSFNQTIRYCIPKSVKYLEFGDDFNQKIYEQSISDSLVCLTIGSHFSHLLCLITMSIEYLTFRDDFNKCIADLPTKITHLTFGHRFNQSITERILGFAGSIYIKSIPNSVTHLTFGDDFNKPTFGGIPNSTTHLKFGKNFNQFLCTNKEMPLTHLTYDVQDKYMPPSVIELTLSKDYKHDISGLTGIKIIRI